MGEHEYLPLAYLNAWEYCHRRFYLEYELGEMADNEHIIAGRYLHENIDEEGENRQGDTLTHRHQWVWSERLQIHGIIDAVEERDGDLIPLEFKKGKMGKHLNDHFQLCAAGLCLEERTGREVAGGEIFYYGSRRRQKIVFSPQLRQATEEAIRAARAAAAGDMPAPVANRKKCRDCSLQGICLPFEVELLCR